MNADLRKYPGTNVVCDARALPFRKESFDGVKLIHAIEHFDNKEGFAVLSDIVGVMKAGAELTVEGPDVEKCMMNFSDKMKGIKWIFGYSEEYLRDKAYGHKWGYTGEIVSKILKYLGLKIKVVTVGRSHGMPDRDYRVTGVKE